MIYSYPKPVEVAIGAALTLYVAIVFVTVACEIVGVIR